jgi:hypothetical protein
MIDLLVYSAPLMMVGVITALLLPHSAAAVVAAQAGFLAMDLLGCAIGAFLARHNGEEALW